MPLSIVKWPSHKRPPAPAPAPDALASRPVSSEVVPISDTSLLVSSPPLSTSCVIDCCGVSCKGETIRYNLYQMCVCVSKFIRLRQDDNIVIIVPEEIQDVLYNSISATIATSISVVC